jgi:putative phosphoribosyl transferase
MSADVPIPGGSAAPGTLPPGDPFLREQVEVVVDGVAVPVALTVPPRARAVVVLARGTTGSGLGERSRRMVSALTPAGYAVLLPTLWQPSAQDDSPVDVRRLAARLVAVTRWARLRPATAGLPVGLLASSTGAAVALLAAAELDGEVAAVAARAGRPDAAGLRPAEVSAATLLIVGGADPVGVGLNGDVEPLLRGPRSLRIIPGATRRFTEPGVMDEAVGLVLDWFGRYLPGSASPVGQR